MGTDMGTDDDGSLSRDGRRRPMNLYRCVICGHVRDLDKEDDKARCPMGHKREAVRKAVQQIAPSLFDDRLEERGLEEIDAKGLL